MTSPMAGGRDRQDAWEGYGKAWSIIGTLLAGLAVWGGIGYLIDRLAGFHALFLPIGLVIGAIGGVYIVVVRYGRDDPPKLAPARARDGPPPACARRPPPRGCHCG